MSYVWTDTKNVPKLLEIEKIQKQNPNKIVVCMLIWFFCEIIILQFIPSES